MSTVYVPMVVGRQKRERATFQLSDAFNFTVHLLKRTQIFEPKANLDNDIDGMIKFSVEFDKGREMLFISPFLFNFSQFLQKR
ncbi:hypothetical protein NC653_025224 [Populus alba x Populus x berolinensis]|uniref:Uncharacterized protein n=1 Tax=Populus alba x Populus x berolinensis TaxID=444605 RepID=A0AAD6MB95_9ROSI|nr:hypothetical protein NC653_025224 [Populus alba x Populus x berolinensis]